MSSLVSSTVRGTMWYWWQVIGVNCKKEPPKDASLGNPRLISEVRSSTVLGTVLWYWWQVIGVNCKKEPTKDASLGNPHLISGVRKEQYLYAQLGTCLTSNSWTNGWLRVTSQYLVNCSPVCHGRHCQMPCSYPEPQLMFCFGQLRWTSRGMLGY